MKVLVKIVVFVLFVNFFQPVFAFTTELKSDNIANSHKSIQKKESIELSNKNKMEVWKTKQQLAIQLWKQKKRKMINEIYKQTNIATLMDLNSASIQIANISSKLEDINMSYKTIKKQKKNIDKKYRSVLKYAKDTIIELNKRNKSLKLELLHINILSNDLKSIKKQIKSIDDIIYVSKKQVKKYIWLLYKINNDYYDSIKWLDEVKLLFKTDNIAKSLSKEDIIKMLSLKTQDLLLKLKNSKNKKNKFLKKLYSKKIEYINNVNKFKVKIKLLNQKRKFLIDLLTMLKKNKKDIDSVYKWLNKKRNTLKKQQISLTKSLIWIWKNVIWDEKTKKIDLSSILKYTTKIDWDKFLSWPVSKYPKLSATFHDPEYFKKFGWEHDGIDIKVNQLTPIYSAAAWYVYHVSDNNSSYYNYIVIVHNYWYISIYWHIYKSFVKEGDIVQRWQLIAASWWKKWTRWAWKASTGPHLHFEIYKNWQLIDPLSVLDLSVYNSKDDVPQNWQLKYLKDGLTRKINLDWLHYFPKKFNHKQREELFLKLRWASWFNNLTWWVQPAKKFAIDPDVAICIWYSETWLWHNTASNNNVWNVWNNDRWDRVDKTTPQQGIISIYYALNNKYLSKYHTIDRLSRWWNKNSHIFSSSSYNWQKNMVKCLSMLKWYPVDEYFPFRDISLSDKNKLLLFKLHSKNK